MVSVVESDFDPRRDLAEAERAAAAPYVDYPRTPTWYPPAVGVWAAALVAVLGVEGHTLRSAGLAALLVLEALFLAWYRRKRGVMPNLRGAPREIAREMRWYVVGAVVVVAVVGGAFAVSSLLAAAVALVLVTVGVAAYERRYEAAAARTRDRLA
jgi:hypothetical protein